MPDLALNPEKSLSPNPLNPTFPLTNTPTTACKPPWKKCKKKRGGGKRLTDPLPVPIYPPSIIKSHRHVPINPPPPSPY